MAGSNGLSYIGFIMAANSSLDLDPSMENSSWQSSTIGVGDECRKVNRNVVATLKDWNGPTALLALHTMCRDESNSMHIVSNDPSLGYSLGGAGILLKGHRTIEKDGSLGSNTMLRVQRWRRPGTCGRPT